MRRNELESMDHVNCPKLPISVEKNLGLQNPIEVFEIHQVAIWSSMELVCKRNRERKLVRQELRIKEARRRREGTLVTLSPWAPHLVPHLGQCKPLCHSPEMTRKSSSIPLLESGI